MRLSMNILREELEKIYTLPSVSRSYRKHKSALSRAELLTREDLESDVLYVAEARRLPVRWKSGNHVALVIVGLVDSSYFAQSKVEYICVDDNSLANVMNSILRIFQKYSVLDEQLKQQVIRGNTTEALCNTISKFLDNPMVVFDSAMRLQYTSPDAVDLLDWELDAYSGLYVLPTEFINQLGMVYTESAENSIAGASLVRDDRLDYSLICTMNGKNPYIIAVFEVRSPLTRGTLELISYINEYLLMAFEADLQKKPSSGGLAPFIVSMLNGNKFSTEDMENHLSSVGWKAKDNCCCIVMRTLKEKHNIKYINSFCLKLENLFPACAAFPYQEWAVAIVNLERSKCNVYDIPHSIATLLRDGLLNAGISFEYWNFDTTPIYYRQACNAYEFGKIYSPTNWCYIFEDYVLYHFMHYGSSRIPPRHLCHPALVHLYLYDQENKTELLRTLETYVNNNCNAVTAANALYIHRNTFYQRLSRIQELVNLDLENDRVRLYLQLSSCLINMYYYELDNGYALR